MSCYAPHPTEVNSKGEPLACRHGEGHRGDHGSECWAWPNEADPLRRELAEAKRLLMQALELLIFPARLRGTSDEIQAWHESAAGVVKAGIEFMDGPRGEG